MESGMGRSCQRCKTVLRICLNLMKCTPGVEITNNLNNIYGIKYIEN